jgi:prepilin-type N-terminal cleavage/methylation domain-containing protein
MKRRAFTLIEVLVVVAIIGLLLAILLPSLERSRELSRRTVCLHNLKMLGQCWTLYHTVNKGALVAGVADSREVTAPTSKDWLKTHAPGWTRYIGTAPNSAPLDQQAWAIHTGALYQYARTEGIYRCPKTRGREMRTYSTNQGAHGYVDGGFDGTTWAEWVARRIDDLGNPGTRLAFFDDFPENWDACWMISPMNPKWWNPLSLRHDLGTTLTFADGHSEWWAWTDLNTKQFAKMSWEDWFKAEGSTKQPQPRNRDLRRLQLACWGRLGYKATP